MVHSKVHLCAQVSAAVQEPSFRVLASRPKMHNALISAMVVDPQTNQLISGSKNGEVRIWDENAKVVRQ